ILTRNIAINNSRYGFYLNVMSNDNVLYLNRLGYNAEYNALDNGKRDSNIWDDGVSVGNWWSDYDGTGTYDIMGFAYSIDRYPLQWTDNIPEIDYFTNATMILAIMGTGIAIGVAILLLLKRQESEVSEPGSIV
ncbi:MAG: hypothetical protein KAU48_03760, partial [Candidatus Thorarchaeota archaeon]|nr:hypothetical protein [Candidatus Thorarchaeota archaeon]